MKNKKKLTILCIVVTCIIFCVGGVILLNSVKYDLFGYRVQIKSMYFGEKEKLMCSKKNPYREQILSVLERLSKKETVDRTQSELDTQFTIISTNGVKYEFYSSATLVPDPMVYGLNYVDNDIYTYCVKVTKGKKEKVYYFDRKDEEVNKLMSLFDDAQRYAYVEIGTIEGVLCGMREDENETYCQIDTLDYGVFGLYAETVDGAKEGDMVEVIFREEPKEAERSNAMYGSLRNISKENPEAINERYYPALEYESHVLATEAVNVIHPFWRGTPECISEEDDWDYLLFDREKYLPDDVVEDLYDTYDEEFFDAYFLVYCGVDTPNAKVTAIVQPGAAGEKNKISIVDGEKEEADSEIYYTLLIEIPKRGWNGEGFELEKE